jgi:hypothetical protein
MPDHAPIVQEDLKPDLVQAIVLSMIGSSKFWIVSENLNLLKSVHKPANVRTCHFGAQT